MKRYMAKHRLIVYNDKYYVQVKKYWWAPWMLCNFYKVYQGMHKHEYQCYETLGYQPIPFTSLDEGKYVVDFLNTHKYGGVFYTQTTMKEDVYDMRYCLDIRIKNANKYFEAYSRKDLESRHPVFIKNAKVIYE